MDRPKRQQRRRAGKPDAPGLGGVTVAIIEAPARGADAVVITSAVVGVAVMVGLFAWERRASHPMLPLSIFGSRQFSAANAVTLFINDPREGLTWGLALNCARDLRFYRLEVPSESR